MDKEKKAAQIFDVYGNNISPKTKAESICGCEVKPIRLIDESMYGTWLCPKCGYKWGLM